jgi:hypothetical protein
LARSTGDEPAKKHDLIIRVDLLTEFFSSFFLLSFHISIQTPTCALQSPDGEKYCAILCQPKEGELGDGDCGPEMSCSPIPGSGGFGICVYPMSSYPLRIPANGQYEFAITE